jgi:hypothetical protein
MPAAGLHQTRQRRGFAWEGRVLEDPRTVENPPSQPGFVMQWPGTVKE